MIQICVCLSVCQFSYVNYSFLVPSLYFIAFPSQHLAPLQHSAPPGDWGFKRRVGGCCRHISTAWLSWAVPGRPLFYGRRFSPERDVWLILLQHAGTHAGTRGEGRHERRHKGDQALRPPCHRALLSRSTGFRVSLLLPAAAHQKVSESIFAFPAKNKNTKKM